jgi:hypothetical protein
MDEQAYELAETERRLARRGLLRQVAAQAVALFFFWMAANAVVRVALSLYVEFDLELPVNTINFVVWPGPMGIGLATLAPGLVMLVMPWFPFPKLAAGMASLLFLGAVFFLAFVVVSAVLPFEDLRMIVPAA